MSPSVSTAYFLLAVPYAHHAGVKRESHSQVSVFGRQRLETTLQLEVERLPRRRLGVSHQLSARLGLCAVVRRSKASFRRAASFVYGLGLVRLERRDLVTSRLLVPRRFVTTLHAATVAAVG